MKYLAVIPARGGSKGVPGKNVRSIGGKPLIAWSIGHALNCRADVHAHVSTDDAAIADVAREHGADVPFLRPAALAQDSTPTEPVMRHSLDWYEAAGQLFDAIVLLQPTSPLRHAGTLDAAISTFEASGATSLLGVTENHHFFWRDRDRPEPLYDYEHRPRRQDIRPEDRWYRENGSIYITRTDGFRRYGNRLCKPLCMYLMREEESWEIDSLADFAVVEALMSQRWTP